MKLYKLLFIPINGVKLTGWLVTWFKQFGRIKWKFLKTRPKEGQMILSQLVVIYFHQK